MSPFAELKARLEVATEWELAEIRVQLDDIERRRCGRAPRRMMQHDAYGIHAEAFDCEIRGCIPVEPPSQSGELRAPLDACCVEWEDGIKQLANTALLAAVHGAAGYSGRPFQFCPWCLSSRRKDGGGELREREIDAKVDELIDGICIESEKVGSLLVAGSTRVIKNAAAFGAIDRLDAAKDALHEYIASIRSPVRSLDTAFVDAIERGDIWIESMGTTNPYFNVCDHEGRLHTTAGGQLTLRQAIRATLQKLEVSEAIAAARKEV